jgi:hypothetical protein
VKKIINRTPEGVLWRVLWGQKFKQEKNPPYQPHERATWVHVDELNIVVCVAIAHNLFKAKRFLRPRVNSTRLISHLHMLKRRYLRSNLLESLIHSKKSHLSWFQISDANDLSVI